LSPYLTDLQVVQYSYRQIFQTVTGLDALEFQTAGYARFAAREGFPEAEQLCGGDHALWLDFLFSHCVQSALPVGCICLVHGYPAIQSSLARISAEDARVSERFEVFIGGMELGNGFYELCDAEEQECRFEGEMAYRALHGLPPVEKDGLFVQALQAGLPECSGIAIGLDRLMMVAFGVESITEVMAFPLANA
jgi:lysyl-tRNA synthetase class 2